jgi:hypothetical protein
VDGEVGFEVALLITGMNAPCLAAFERCLFRRVLHSSRTGKLQLVVFEYKVPIHVLGLSLALL